MANLEVKIKAPQTQPVVWNFEELHTALEMKLADYKDRVYDETMIAEAKADRANLNKLGNALNDERIAREKEYMKPFLEFKEQVAELIGMIKEAKTSIDNQLDAYEQKRIEEKRTAIRELFSEIASNYDALDFITLEKIYNPKWENKTATDKAIATEITEVFEKAVKDLEIINKMPYYFEAQETYKDTLDLNKALEQGERIAQIEASKRQAQAEPSKAEPTEDEPVYCFKFACNITQTQAIALKQFCNENKIKLIRI